MDGLTAFYEDGHGPLAALPLWLRGAEAFKRLLMSALLMLGTRDAKSAVVRVVSVTFRSIATLRGPQVLPSAGAARSGIGSAVVDLIRSMAKREVTFLSGTEAIRRL